MLVSRKLVTLVVCLLFSFSVSTVFAQAPLTDSSSTSLAGEADDSSSDFVTCVCNIAGGGVWFVFKGEDDDRTCNKLCTDMGFMGGDELDLEIEDLLE